MKFKKIIKMFERANVIVCGKIGRGKDMLISNVIARRHKPYISNVPYGGKQYPLEMSRLDCGGNSYKDFVDGTLRYYEAQYPDGTDIYISDVGVYFPAQYASDLNKTYPYFATFFALVRHIQDAHIHVNTQAYGRCWDKLREQADEFVYCRRCKVIPIFGRKLVIQKIRLYDRAQSCADEVPPYPKKLFKGVGLRREIYKQQERTYLINYGSVRNATLIYWHKGNYDTRYFKRLLEGGIKDDETTQDHNDCTVRCSINDLLDSFRGC